MTIKHRQAGWGVVERIVSGGQSGVDRAALDVALALGYACGGWCPKGRRAEDGPIDVRYPLIQTNSDRYLQRTRWNVRDSDATLILLRGQAEGGTLKTIDFANRQRKPLCIVDLDTSPEPPRARQWIKDHAVSTLNVAGPRESKTPGIYADASQFLRELLAE